MRWVRPSPRWLFGRSVDLAVFAGSALASCLGVFAARCWGYSGETPAWAFLLLVVGVDVAHVWATLFRTYLDPEELRARPGLYLVVPLAAYALGALAYQSSPLTFWRVLAYLALGHFVRQQYGWMALYGRREGAPSWERRLDAAAIYAATLGPAVWWHANLPRPYAWFIEGDFAPGLPAWVGTAALALHAGVLLTWAGLQASKVLRGVGVQPGKLLLVLATWSTWFGGIVLAPDDFTFTVMNVVLHGVPYTALLWRYAKGRAAESQQQGLGGLALRAGWPGFVLLLCLAALLEEGLWDRWVWGERPELFGAGAGVEAADVLALLVPLLALPQATHYVLDAFIWKAGRDARLLTRLGWGADSREPPHS